MHNLMSEQIDQLATALAKAQSEFNTAGKNKNNPFFKSRYADFEAIIDASRTALTKNGLSVVQSVMTNDTGDSSLITILMHSSGQWIRSVAKHQPAKQDIQSLSSYNTYLKRMCYTSLVGVAIGEEDDDGESDRRARENNNFVSNNAQTDMASNKQIEYLRSLIHQTDEMYEPQILKLYKVTTLDQLNAGAASSLIQKLNDRIKAQSSS